VGFVLGLASYLAILGGAFGVDLLVNQYVPFEAELDERTSTASADSLNSAAREPGPS
jgi:hypothetical protein